MDAATSWTCPNCSKPLDTPFCPQCGERRLTPADQTLRGLLGRVLHAVTSIDGQLLRTFKRLLAQPGSLTVAYLEGARQPYVAPIQLFLVANVLFFAIQSLTHQQVFSSTLDSHLHQQDWSTFAQDWVTERLQRRQVSLDVYAAVFDRAVVLHAKSLIILMVVPFALLTWLFSIRGSQPHTTQFNAQFVFSLHLYTFLLLVFCVDLLLAGLSVLAGGPGIDSPRVDNLLSALNLLACAGYVYAALGPVYGSTGLARAAKAITLALAAGFIVLGYRFALFVITFLVT